MTDDLDLTLRRGYPPSAHRVVCVDYDGTLFPFGYLDADPEPLPGAAEAMRRLQAHGYRIVVFTSRMSPTWLASTGHTAAEASERVAASLRRHGIPFDDITADKVPAAWYIDDRALRFDGDWPPITDFILWKDDDLD